LRNKKSKFQDYLGFYRGDTGVVSFHREIRNQRNEAVHVIKSTSLYRCRTRSWAPRGKSCCRVRLMTVYVSSTREAGPIADRCGRSRSW